MIEIVNAFLKAAAARDYDTALPMLTEDIEYQNMMLPAVHGRDQVQETLEGLLALCTGVGVGGPPRAVGRRPRDERAHRPVPASASTWIDLPVMGVFTLRDGQIALWRDYFDLQTVMAALG